MTTGLYKKGIVLGIVMLFIGTSVVPNIMPVSRADANSDNPTAPYVPEGKVPNTSGDNPPTTSFRWTGYGNVVVDVYPTPSTANPSGSFTINGIPAGSTIIKAYMYVTSWEDSLTSISATLNGHDLGTIAPFSHDQGWGYDNTQVYDLHAWRWDVTSIVVENGDYSFTTSGVALHYGSALVVVYSNPSEHYRQIIINDGAESLDKSESTATFYDALAGSGNLIVFTQADDWTGSSEKIEFNDELILGPGNIFNANQGTSSSLFILPISTISGTNTVTITTDVDWFGWHLAILAIESGGNQPPVANAGGPYFGALYNQINFDASASHDDGWITGYRWDWENDGTYDTPWLSSPVIGYIFEQNEEKHGTLKLEVKDNNGDTGSDIADIDIKHLIKISSTTNVEGINIFNSNSPSFIRIPLSFIFFKNLQHGNQKEEVRYLQIVLNSDPETQLNVQPPLPGSPGYESDIFGPATVDAVKRFQQKYQIEKTGYVGPITRSKLNELLGIIKHVPNDWILNVINTHENNLIYQDYIWWEVKDITDGSSGWCTYKDIISGKIFLENQGIDVEKIRQLTTIESREEIIYETVNHYYFNENTVSSLYSSKDMSRDGSNNDFLTFKIGGLLKEIIFAIIAQESGGVDYDNEIISTSGGYGIMQITGINNKGWGSKLWSCDSCETCKWYTNTPQGIYANIKDGLRVLKYAYSDKNKYIGLNPDEIAYEKDGIVFTNGDMRIILALWLYGPRGNYLKDVADELKRDGEKSRIEQDFGFTYDNPDLIDILYKKIIYAHNHKAEMKIESPCEPRIYDLQGKVTGVINGQIKEEIPNSIYDDLTETILIFFPYNKIFSYMVVGTDEGTYRLSLKYYESDNEINFFAGDILISPYVTHNFIIDWAVLSQGGEGVTIQIDNNNDGIFERTITSDSELTQDEFLLLTATTIDIDPDTLNLNSEGNWITCYIELPDGYNVEDINITTILLNDDIPAKNHPTNIGDYDNDGIPDLMVKFDRQAVQDILEIGDTVAIMVAGELTDETMFEGTDYIKVI